jgi:membrane protease YdiL (CAAX protease family)
MRGETHSDVLKVWLYAAASVLLGAWLAPLIYNAGKALAEVSSAKQTNGLLEWLAGICRAADFPGFFQTSLLIAAAILFLPFIGWLRGGRNPDTGVRTTLRLPEAPAAGQRLLPNPHGLRQGASGFLLVTCLFLLMAGVLIFADVLLWKSPEASLTKIVLRGSAVALGLAVFQEIIFRGVAMGIFLRAMRPAAALGMSAVLFALVHFLNPPPGLNVVDPDASGVGFELLRKIAGQFSDPRIVLGTFTPLLALGFVLAYARWRTASLWLPIGLHAGWIFVNGLLGTVTLAATRADSVLWVISGASLRQGLIPLAGIVLAGVLANYLTTSGDVTGDRKA